MNTLKLSQPLYLSEHYNIPVEKSAWNGLYMDVPKQGRTPERSRASFSSWKKSLIPTSQLAQDIETTFGIYILAMDIPIPAYYVGIASGTGSHPEGVGNRVRKHRVKFSGAHVGGNQRSVGGVNHTQGWREFAPARHRYFSETGVFDFCSDVRLIVGEVTLDSGMVIHEKTTLERFESSIATNENQVLDQIMERLWPSLGQAHVQRLITRHGKLKLESGDRILLW
jgi:hypothetical protein